MDTSTLTARQISELTEAQIKAFTVEQLRLIPTPLVMAFTDAQKSHMNADQLAALPILARE